EARPPQCRREVRFEGEIRLPPARVLDRLRVGDGDDRPSVTEYGGDGEGRRITRVVAVRLECRPEHRDTHTVDVVLADLQGELDHPVTPPQVDRVDLLEEAHGLSGAQVVRPCDERADVLGQAAAPETQAGVQELPS